MTVFIDTSVIMYAAGAPHRHRASCQAVLRQVANGELQATTSVEVVQEILHRFSRGQRETGALMAQHVLDLFGPLLAVDQAAITGAVSRFRQSPALSARDSLHVATCLMNDITEIVTVDTGFDAVDDVTRIDPHDRIEPP